MVKLIRANQKKFLAGLTILSMITFLVNRGTGGDHSAAEVVYGTVAGKPIYTSEVKEARAELSALKTNIDFSDQPTDQRGRLQNPRAELMHQLITLMSSKPDLYLLLRHEAITAGVQVSDDDVNGIMATYAGQLRPETDEYTATYAGATGLLKILSRYDEIADMLKISKPQIDHALVEEGEKIQLDLLQLKASDFSSKVPSPTTQQLQDQFTQFAAVTPKQPTPTTNPFGFGYRLPMRAQLQYVRLSPDAVNTAVVATKSAYDWEVQARKYYLAHLDEFPTTAPTTTSTVAMATTLPTGPLPFIAVQDKILTQLRQPLVSALMDQVQRQISTTLSTDWQTYSQYVTTAKPGPEPVSSLGVPYTSFDYLNKLAGQIESKFNVKILVALTAGALSKDELATQPGIGTADIADAVMGHVTDYLTAVDKKDPAAPAQLIRPSAATPGSDEISVVIYRITQALPSEPAPNLQSVQAQAAADVRTAAAYNLAEAKARDIVANISNRPLLVAATPENPLIHLDDISAFVQKIPEIKPDLGDSLRSFTRQAIELLSDYDPTRNRNPATVISIPEQQRVFPTRLLGVSAEWNANTFFYQQIGLHREILSEFQQGVLEIPWFAYDQVIKRTDFKLAGKNNS